MKKNIIILHGWGVGAAAYAELSKLLSTQGYNVFAPDLPGFGSEPLSKEVLTLDDYVDFVKKFIRQKVDGKYIVIGHSFGGRIGIKHAASNPGNLSKLILTGAAGIRHPLPFRSKLAFLFAKSSKVLFILAPFRQTIRKLSYKFVGAFDYYKAGKLKETFKKIIDEDLTNYLPKISVPTLLVWAEFDFIVPVSDGRYMNEQIKRSKLIIVKGASHTFTTTMPNVFFENILPFLEK